MARTRVEPNPVSGFAAACLRGAATITSTRSFSATVEICRTCILRARFSRSCPISPKLQDVLLWGTGFVPHKNPKSVHLWRLKARPRISIAKRSQTQPSRLDQVGLEEVCKARLGFPQALGSDLVYARFRRIGRAGSRVVFWPSVCLEAWGTKAKNQSFPEKVWLFGLGTPGLRKNHLAKTTLRAIGPNSTEPGLSLLRCPEGSRCVFWAKCFLGRPGVLGQKLVVSSKSGVCLALVPQASKKPFGQKSITGSLWKSP
jgi:hypothetical protein